VNRATAALVPLVVTSSRFIQLGSQAIAHQTVDQNEFNAAGAAFAVSVGVVLLAASAVLISVIINRISRWQQR
jgi:hypothetical protein